MSSLNLPVQALEFKDLRESFIEFLQGQTTYKDFNFEGSGISTQMNILAYSTHMLGFYVKMLLDEAFVDSAHTREAMLSHAKKTAYVPKGRRAARAQIELKISMDVAQIPQNDMVYVPRGTSFSSANAQQDSRLFQIPDDVIAKQRTIVGSVATYSTGPLMIYEGQSLNWRFLADASQLNQRFVIKDKNLDLDTLRVNVRQNAGSSEVQQFKMARYTDDIDGTTPVYYITTNENGYYQIFFGNNVFGIQPSHGNVIEVTYVGTNGLSGNGAKVFQFNAPAADLNTEYHVGNFDDFEVVTLSPSSGGMEEESVDSMRFTIPNHYRRQNRLLTAADFRGVLLEEFRNIDSLNVWGGEQHYQRDYGKVYCSIKPRNALYLTGASKDEIGKAIVERYGIVGGQIVFVDPEYINAKVTATVTVDRKRTNKNLGEIEADVLARIANYNDTRLSKFQSSLSDIEMLNAAKAGDSYITTIYSTKTLEKDATVIYGSTGTSVLNYANAIVPGSVKSIPFQYGGKDVHFKDDGAGFVYIVEADDSTLFITGSQGTVNYETGTVEFLFPSFARVAGFVEQSAKLTFSAVPKSPDVTTDLNNIVRITATRVLFK